MYDYTKNLRWSRLRVGILVSGALVLIFLTAMFASNITELFVRKVTIYSDFTDVRGLKTGAPVELSGVEIGNVKKIFFESTGAVRVAMTIRRDYLRFIRTDSVVTVKTLGLLGDKYLELSAGTEGELGPGGAIAGMSPSGLQEITGVSSTVISKLGELAVRLEHITALIEKGEGSASLFIRNPALYNNLNLSAERLAAITASIEKGQGTLGRLLRDDSLYTELKASAGEFRGFAMSLSNSDGTLNKLIKDRTLYDRFLSAANSLDNFSTRLEKANGTLDRLIEDKSVYDNLNTSTRELSVVLGRLEKGEGTLGGLTENGHLSGDLEQTIKDLKALIEDIKKNPGKYFKVSIF